MQKNRFLYAIIGIIVLLGSAFSVSAQDATTPLDIGGMTVAFPDPTGLRYDISGDLLEQPTWNRMTATQTVNVRTGASMDAAIRQVVDATAILQVLTEPQGTDAWVLVRAFDANGLYQDFGWLASSVAQLAPVTDVGTLPTLSVPTCGMVETSRQIPTDEGLVRFGPGWLFDVMSTSCNTVIEGRQNTAKAHHIWVLHDLSGFNTVDTLFGLMYCLECSVWENDQTWNLGDFTTEKAPIAGELVWAKHQNMLDNGYDWSIYVHQVSGTIVEFPSDQTPPAVELYNSCEFDTPEFVEVTGIPVEGSPGRFVASIGDHQCRVLVFAQTDADTSIEAYLWVNARDNFEFRSLHGVWMIPSDWNDAQVNAFVDMTVGGFPAGTQIDDVEGVLELQAPEATAEPSV